MARATIGLWELFTPDLNGTANPEGALEALRIKAGDYYSELESSFKGKP